MSIKTSSIIFPYIRGFCLKHGLDMETGGTHIRNILNPHAPYMQKMVAHVWINHESVKFGPIRTNSITIPFADPTFFQRIEQEIEIIADKQKISKLPQMKNGWPDKSE